MIAITAAQVAEAVSKEDDSKNHDSDKKVRVV